jgi:hypothetical protein
VPSTLPRGDSYGFSSIKFCPVGTRENSPAIHRWVSDLNLIAKSRRDE